MSHFQVSNLLKPPYIQLKINFKIFVGNCKVKIDELNEKFVCQAHEKSVNCVAINTAGTHILVSLKGLEDGPLWIIL